MTGPYYLCISKSQSGRTFWFDRCFRDNIYLCRVIRIIAAILIITHIHHSFVMITGDIMKIGVVSAAIEAGIPLFEHNGLSDAAPGAEAPETAETDDADFCCRNFLSMDCRPHSFQASIRYRESSLLGVHPVHVEILTPPPQTL